MKSNALIKPVTIIAIFLAVLFAFGLRVQHPQAGLGNALGSAESSLVIVKQTTSVKSGDKIVAATNIGESPVLGIVATIENGSIEMLVEKGVARTTPEQVSGKLLVVIPFVGYLFNIVGL